MPDYVRGKHLMLNGRSEERVFRIAYQVAEKLCRLLQVSGTGVPKEICDLACRHAAATRFLVMNDLVGLLRPLVDALEVCREGGYEGPSFPFHERLAATAAEEIKGWDEVNNGHLSNASMHGVHLGSAQSHLVDTSSMLGLPDGLRPDIVIEPTTTFPQSFRPIGLICAFRLLRQASVPPALSFLLSHVVHRILNGRLEQLAGTPLQPCDLAAHPIVYWTNMSLRSVFHASKRRLLGLPTIAAHTILMTQSERYICDVFDATLSVGTGQPLGNSQAFRGRSAIEPRMLQSCGPVMLALQPQLDILRNLSRFGRIAAEAGHNVIVRPHPAHRRAPQGLVVWREMAPPWVEDFDVTPGTASLVVTGTSNFAIEACLAGCPVVLVASDFDRYAIWGRHPAPGLHIAPERLLALSTQDITNITLSAFQATRSFIDYYTKLPVFHIPVASDEA
ncbi:hypothetical protein BPNPMPFG_007890 (plasmid) [Mesorhizobium sp. AR07]|uniref:hypothetical protein n=1 Tax=Mesorhizobium sp. AR07 TaxID=2865838 RepID=UPI00215F5DD1|nr:hypothetical protein [Mesorhizobium sp. AR07]UVK48507.1 hypothetical protein BPNPMPFG_007890 [Mesorhizobium sp. AR07]